MEDMKIKLLFLVDHSLKFSSSMHVLSESLLDFFLRKEKNMYAANVIKKIALAYRVTWPLKQQ
jgi:hypothetical protein